VFPVLTLVTGYWLRVAFFALTRNPEPKTLNPTDFSAFFMKNQD
jgi:hypothetical protein